MSEGADNEVTVESLLQWKRGERPSREFWDRFDAEFNQKQLKALLNVEAEKSPQATWLFRSILTGAGVSALAFVLALIWMADFQMRDLPVATPEVVARVEVLTPLDRDEVRMLDSLASNVDSTDFSASDGSARIQFVQDSIVAPSRRESFHKVLHQPTIPLRGVDAGAFADDRLRSTDVYAAPAVISLSRQF